MSRRKRPVRKLRKVYPYAWNPPTPRQTVRPSLMGAKKSFLLLRVRSDYFVAGALFEKLYGVWACVKAAPILHWMVGKSPLDIKFALLKMGASFQWIAPKARRTSASRQHPQAAANQVGGTNPSNGMTNAQEAHTLQKLNDTVFSVACPSLQTAGLTQNAALSRE